MSGNFISVGLVVSLTLVASAERTVSVDVVSFGRLGTGVTADGWRCNDLSNFAKDRWYALQFPKLAESRVTSPVFDERITHLAFTVFSSSNVNRRLVFTPSSKGETIPALAYACDYSPTAYKRTQQTIAWPLSARVDSFDVRLEGSGRTGWGLVSLDLTLAPPPAFVVSVK